jgi:hypothetical protein
MKRLMINDVCYAKYELDGERLFLKMIRQIIPGKDNVGDSENLLVYIIQSIENKKFKYVGFLNV